MSIEYPCVYWSDGMCKKFSDDKVTSWCVEGPCGDQMPSNADKIRAMSDDELAEWLTEFANEAFAAGAIRFGGALMTEHDRLTWLQQPAEGGER